MRQAADRGPQQDPLAKAVEVMCVVVVVAALIALVVWMLFHTGGGVLYQG